MMPWPIRPISKDYLANEVNQPKIPIGILCGDFNKASALTLANATRFFEIVVFAGISIGR